MKRFLCYSLITCLLLSLCACGQAAADPKASTPAVTTEGTTEPVDDGKVTYTVKVVDEGGNPVANAAVQICKDSCLPGMTNAEGVATFRVAEDAYKVSFMAMPAGFEAEAEEFYFEDGAYELTITLKAVA
jgi:hypothetical protein